MFWSTMPSMATQCPRRLLTYRKGGESERPATANLPAGPRKRPRVAPLASQRKTEHTTSMDSVKMTSGMHNSII